MAAMSSILVARVCRDVLSNLLILDGCGYDV